MSKVQRDPAPTTFRERLLAHEHQRHAARLAEIKAAETRIRAFEPIFATLQAREVYVSCSYTLGNYYKSLTLSGGGLTEWDHKIYNALIDLGFKEIERGDSGEYVHCTLQQGRQKVRLFIKSGHRYAQRNATPPEGASMIAAKLADMATS